MIDPRPDVGFLHKGLDLIPAEPALITAVVIHSPNR